MTVDAQSRPYVITDGAGHVETIAYDKLDRVTEIADTGTGAARTVKFEYDTDGNLVKREDPAGTTKYTFDGLNRLTKEALPTTQNNEYGYDAASNMSFFTDAGGTTKYAYNILNELKAVTEPGEAKSTEFEYDGDHRLTKVTYPSGARETGHLRPQLLGHRALFANAIEFALEVNYASLDLSPPRHAGGTRSDNGPRPRGRPT